MGKIKKLLKTKWLWITACIVLGLEVWLLAPACRFSAYGIWAVGVVISCYLLLERWGGKQPTKAKCWKWIVTLLLCLILLAMAVTEGFIVSASKGTRDNDSPYLLVLGAGVDGKVPSLSLTERLAAAITYLNTHQDAVCIVSGGQGSGEEITEAECMFDWLTQHGIAPERIILEEHASSTAENLAFSLELLEKRGADASTLAVVSSEYHLFRAELMGKRLGIQVLGVPARTSLPLLRLNYYFREIFGVWYFLIFGK